jgi:ferrous iron transport protein B
LLLNLPWGVEDQRDSLFGHTSAAIAPIFEPLGFGNWESAGALVSGFVAKEIVISTMSQIYVGAEQVSVEMTTTFGEDLIEIAQGFGAATLNAAKLSISTLPGIDFTDDSDEEEDTALSVALRDHFTPLTAVALMAFVLLYVPCVATLGAIRHEYGGKWAFFSASFQLTLAWVVAFLIYQGGKFLGI